MATIGIGGASLNTMQSAQDKFKTQMQVDGFNSKLEDKKISNKMSQKDEFLRILVTQLKNQNPLEPIKDKEFIAQMAQLSSVEKLEQLNSNMTKIGDATNNTSLFNLIGKKVSFINNRGQEDTGIVDGINLKKGKGFISVNGKEMNLENITKIQQLDKSNKITNNNN